MKKFLTLVLTLILASSASFAAKIPDDVREYILNKVPNTDIRFDGVVILPDNTVYLPLFPSLFSDVTSLKVKTSYPENKELNQKPDVLIFNNDFVLMKVLTDSNGNKTVLHMKTPPLQVRTGLLPQDMLVPSGLVLPENIKGIIGNLKVDTKNEDVIKRNSKESYEEFFGEVDTSNDSGAIPQLKNKVLFVMTNYSKNIQVFNPFNIVPVYSLAQKSIPIDIEPVNKGKFLLVTSYQRTFVDVISVADSRFIKQINLDAFAGEILVDETANKAYVTVPTNSTICVIDLKTMSLIQKIRVNGYCEKLLKSEDKLFYVDKLKSEIWAIELAKDYELKDIGRFPNVSDMVFKNDKLFLASRTKSRVAVIDYTTLGLISEFTTVNKPVALKIFGDTLYILGAQNSMLQAIDMVNHQVISNTEIFAEGFTTSLNVIDNSNYAVATDVKKNRYAIIDLSKNAVLGRYSLRLPVKEVVITNKVELFK